MKYVQYLFTVEPVQPGSDILIALLADTGFESFTQLDNGLEAYIAKDLDDERLVRQLTFDDFKFSYERQAIEQENWNETWERNFEPVYVEDLCCIRAPFHEKPANVQQDIVIMPKMSFGTGHHDTTWLMCRHLFELDLAGKRVLDMGCGTGVLAILARKLGADMVSGIDIDDWSVENALENTRNNGCTDINIAKGDASDLPIVPVYNVILANINKNVLKADMKTYHKCLEKKGKLLLSGFFKTDVEELRQLAEGLGFHFLKVAERNDWAMLMLEK